MFSQCCINEGCEGYSEKVLFRTYKELFLVNVHYIQRSQIKPQLQFSDLKKFVVLELKMRHVQTTDNKKNRFAYVALYLQPFAKMFYRTKSN